MTENEELLRLRKEMRKLRKDVASTRNAWEAQKKKNKSLEVKLNELVKENRLLVAQNKALREENDKLKEKFDDTKKHNDTLKGMIFKPEVREKSGKKRGAQPGHEAHTRKTPEIDEEKKVYLSNCPECETSLTRTNSYYSRIVEDIAPPKKYVTTKYDMERQWCPRCKKEITATPKDTVKGFRIGLNAVSYVLYHKYRLRMPLAKIKESLKEHFNFNISVGEVQKILHSAREWFGADYDLILKEIRGAPLIHADETGWRIDGKNNWCWLFVNEKAAYFTIEETRGKGVPTSIIKENPNTVLVRDDYAAYSKLPVDQQSCWAHLLRKSHDESARGSVEAEELHRELSGMFKDLSSIVSSPFVKRERIAHYANYQSKLRDIINRKYSESQALAIQTRLSNQEDNLITALLHEGVPLTNNMAERNIRPMVVTRKISGGSRSNEGAATHAVNMSVTQTLALKGKPFYSGVRELLENGGVSFLTDERE